MVETDQLFSYIFCGLVLFISITFSAYYTGLICFLPGKWDKSLEIFYLLCKKAISGRIDNNYVAFLTGEEKGRIIKIEN